MRSMTMRSQPNKLLQQQSVVVLSLIILLGCLVPLSQCEVASYPSWGMYEPPPPLELQYPTESSCFTLEDPPSCESTLSTHPSVDINAECSKLDRYFSIYWDTHPRLAWANASMHARALAGEIPSNSLECLYARQVYHHCYWCAPSEWLDQINAAQGAERPDNIFEDDLTVSPLPLDFCLNGCNPPRLFPNSTNDLTRLALVQDINETCRSLQSLYFGGYPATVDLCFQSEVALSHCSFYCGDGSYLLPEPTSDSCFTYENPPSCAVPDPDRNAQFRDYQRDHPDDFDLSSECQQLRDPFFRYGFYSLTGIDMTQRVQVLADSLKQGTEACTRAQLVYPYCNFCAPLAIPNFEQTPLVYSFCDSYGGCEPKEPDLVEQLLAYRVLYDSTITGQPTSSLTSSNFNETINVTATCEELQYQYPTTMAGCIELALVGPYCQSCVFSYGGEHTQPTLESFPEPDETSCFTYDSPPTCQPDADADIAFANASDPYFGNKECTAIEAYFMRYEAWVELDVHVNSLASLKANTSECDTARRFYHLCYWCTPPEPEEEKLPYDYCWNHCEKPNDHESANDTVTNDTCARIQELYVLNEYAWPTTIENCYLWSNVWACEFYCGTEGTLAMGIQTENERVAAGPPRNVSKTRSVSPTAFDDFKANLTNISDYHCFTYDDPPSCDHEDDFDVVSRSLDVQEQCSLLDQEYLYPNGIVFEHDYHIHAFATGMYAFSPQCIRARRVYHLCYFCRDRQPVNESWCDLSQDSCRVKGYRNPGLLDTSVQTAKTCSEIEDLLFIKEQLPATTELCRRAEVSLFSCDFWCNSYLGATTTEEKRALVWMARVAAGLSLMGALYILIDIALNPNHHQSVYHRLLIGMAIFDIVTAGAWAFSTAAIPKDEAPHIVGANGNEATCKAQAFFVQLGLTSVFYNVSLSVYYVLVVVRGWREADLKKIHVVLHVAPTMLGLGLAGAVVPFADWIGYGCHVRPPPDGPIWQSMLFVVVPVGFSIVCITASMLHMYLDVRRKALASRKWSFGVGSRKSLETQVFWRALLYTLSFFCTWPLLFLVYSFSLDYKVNSFWLSLLVSFVAPLQGFNNFLVYVRPRLATGIKDIRARVSAFLSTTASTGFGSSAMETEHPSMDPSAAIELSGSKINNNKRSKRNTGWQQNNNKTLPHESSVEEGAQVSS